MDHLTIPNTKRIQARWILTALEKAPEWVRMTFKSQKSSALIIRKGKVSQKFQLTVQRTPKPSFVGTQIKCLWRWYDDLHVDQNNIRKVQQQVKESLRNMDSSGLPGTLRAWVYYHGLLPQLIWPVTLYDIGLSVVEATEHTISRHHRRRLGVPPTLTS